MPSHIVLEKSESITGLTSNQTVLYVDYSNNLIAVDGNNQNVNIGGGTVNSGLDTIIYGMYSTAQGVNTISGLPIYKIKEIEIIDEYNFDVYIHPYYWNSFTGITNGDILGWVTNTDELDSSYFDISSGGTITNIERGNLYTNSYDYVYEEYDYSGYMSNGYDIKISVETTIPSVSPIVNDYLVVFTQTEKLGSHAEGFKTIAGGFASHSEGINTISYGDYSHAEGVTTESVGIGSHSEGIQTEANGKASHAQGIGTKAIGWGSHSSGYYSIANGDFSTAEGFDTITYGKNSHAEGKDTITYGKNSHAEGRETIAKSEASHAEGFRTTSRGFASHAEGKDTMTKGEGSHAEGIDTTAHSDGSHAEGIGTNSKGNSSHSEGYYTSSNSNGSHSEGVYTVAKSEGSHAEGKYTMSIGDSSHAEGYSTYSYGEGSHSEGRLTTARGKGSHAEGIGTISKTIGSHAGGIGSITLNKGEISRSSGFFNTIGDAQTMIVDLMSNGTENPYILKIGNPNESSFIYIPEDTIYHMEIMTTTYADNNDTPSVTIHKDFGWVKKRGNGTELTHSLYSGYGYSDSDVTYELSFYFPDENGNEFGFSIDSLPSSLQHYCHSTVLISKVSLNLIGNKLSKPELFYEYPSSNSVEVTVSAGIDERTTQYTFEISSDIDNFSGNIISTNIESTGATTFNDLESGQTYYVRVKGTAPDTIFINSDWSDIMTITNGT